MILFDGERPTNLYHSISLKKVENSAWLPKWRVQKIHQKNFVKPGDLLAKKTASEQ